MAEIILESGDICEVEDIVGLPYASRNVELIEERGGKWLVKELEYGERGEIATNYLKLIRSK